MLSSFSGTVSAAPTTVNGNTCTTAAGAGDHMGCVWFADGRSTDSATQMSTAVTKQAVARTIARISLGMSAPGHHRASSEVSGVLCFNVSLMQGKDDVSVFIMSFRVAGKAFSSALSKSEYRQ